MLERHALHLRFKDGIGKNESYTRELRRKLSVWDRFRFSEYHYVESGDDLIVPSSIASYLIPNNYPGGTRICVDKIIPQRALDACIKADKPPRDTRQISAIEWMYRYHIDTSIIMMCLHVGAGKTYCGLAHATNLNACTMVLCDRENTMNQWLNSVHEFLNIDSNAVKVITGSTNIKNIFNGKTEPPQPKIVITTIQTVNSLIAENSENFNYFAKALGAGLLIIDEAHENFSGIVKILCHSDICRCLLLTGTPNRSNFKSDYAYQRCFSGVPRFEEPDPDISQRKMIVLTARWNSCSRNNDIFKTQHGFNHVKYTNWLFSERRELTFEMLWKIIEMAVLKATPKPSRAAIIVKTLEAVNDIKQFLIQQFNYHKIALSVGDFTTNVADHQDRRKQLYSDIIVTTDQSFKKAVDIPDLQVMINLIPFSSKPMARQLPGRLRPLASGKSLYVDVLDISSPLCKTAFNYRRAEYDKFVAEYRQVDL